MNRYTDYLTSPGDIHFWIYDDVTNNGVLGLQTKISIQYGFCAPIILVPFIYPMRPSAILKGTSEEHKKQKKHGGRHSNAEKNLPKVKSTVSFWMHSEWSGL